MALDFTIPAGISGGCEQALLRLISDFEEGYITEKGYIKMRHELLDQNGLAPTSSRAAAPGHSRMNSVVTTATTDTTGTTTTTTTSTSNSQPDAEDFYPVGSPSHPPLPNQAHLQQTQMQPQQRMHPAQALQLAQNRQSMQFDDASTYSRSVPLAPGLSPGTSASAGGSAGGSAAQAVQDSMLAYPGQMGGLVQDLQKPLDPRDLDNIAENGTGGVTSLAVTLRNRASTYPKELAMFLVDNKGKEQGALTWDKLYFRAEKVAKQIKNRAALYPGDRVCLIYQNVEIFDFIVALYGCFLSGTVAVPMNSGLPVRDLVSIMEDTQSHLCLMSESVYKHFDKLQHSGSGPGKSSIWPKGVEVWKTSDMGTSQVSHKDGLPPIKMSDLAYIEYSKASTGELKGVAISHTTIMHQMSCLTTVLSSSPEVKKDTLIRPSQRYARIRHLILSHLDVRESIGMIVGALFTVYSGNPLLWIHQRTAEVPGLYAHIISKYRASILLSDYLSLKQVAYNYQSFPQMTRTYNKRVKVNLSSVKWCLINTMTVDCDFDDKLSDRWFKPLGHPNPRRIISPILSLSERGGAIVSMRDWIGKEDHLGCIFNEPLADDIDNDKYEDALDSKDQLSEVLIDKESLTTNTVKVVSDRPPPTSSTYDDESSNYIRVGAFGYPNPDATLAIVNPETKMLSGLLEVGEIWVDSPCISGGYWGRPEETQAVFQTECRDYEGVLDLKFVRTGLLGFIYNGKVYVIGLYEDRVNQAVTWYDFYSSKKNGHKLPSVPTPYRYHYASHLVKTLVRNIPDVIDGSFFNVTVSNEYVPMAILESPIADKKNSTASYVPDTKLDEAAMHDMATQAFELLEKVHNVRPFCITITTTNGLPRTFRSGRLEIANMLCKRRFLQGRQGSCFVQFNFKNSFARIHHGEDLAGGIWSPYSSNERAAVLSYAEQQYSGLDLRESCTDERTNTDLSKYKSLIDLLKVRAKKQPDELAFALIEPTTLKESKPLSWRKFENRVFAVCLYILVKRNVMAGDNVVIIYSLSEEFVICLYACWLAGLTVIPVPPLDPAHADEDARNLVEIVKKHSVAAIFVSNETEQTLKNRPVSSSIKQYGLKLSVVMPKYRNTSKHNKCTQTASYMYKRMETYRKRQRRKRQESLVWTTYSADGNAKQVRVTFGNLMAISMNMKETCQMTGLKPLMASVRHTNGLGFLQAAILGVYLGTRTYLFPTNDYGMQPNSFWSALGRYGIETTYVTEKMLQYAVQRVNPKKCNLSKLANLMVGSSGRPNWRITNSFKEAFLAANLPATAISNVYQHPLNSMITTRSFLSFEPVNLWLDPLALSQGYISLVNPNDTPDSVLVQDSGIVPINTQIAVVNPATGNLCKVGEFGEIWVCSQSTVAGFIDGSEVHGQINNWQADTKYLRTGDFGFLHSVSKRVSHNSPVMELLLLYNLGKIEETFESLGLQYFATDIEATTERFNVIDKACVFKAGQYIVLVLSTPVKQSLSSIVPLITMKLMNKYRLVVDVVTFVVKMPTSRLGEVQRRSVLQMWLNGKLPTIGSYGANTGEESTVATLKKMSASIE